MVVSLLCVGIAAGKDLRRSAGLGLNDSVSWHIGLKVCLIGYGP